LIWAQPVPFQANPTKVPQPPMLVASWGAQGLGSGQLGIEIEQVPAMQRVEGQALEPSGQSWQGTPGSGQSWSVLQTGWAHTACW
jgi:hypothetical protein